MLDTLNSIFLRHAGMNILLIGLWFLSALGDYLYFTYIWQLKEYRLDRFKDFLQSEAGKRFRFGYRVFVRPIILVIAYTLLAADLGVYTLLSSLFILDIVYNFYKFKEGKLYRPKFTPKAIFILATIILLELVGVIILYKWSFILLLVIVRFFYHSLYIQILQLPTQLLKSWYIAKATVKLSKYPQLKKIGITGSFGKSSVKSYLAHYLSAKGVVVKTPKNINTEIGVAKFILETDFSQVDYFVCEMGAYRKGEINKICSMVQPQAGILTTIANQHLSLFGSIENIQQGKYELLRAIPKNGLVITNADNPYCVEYLDQLNCDKKLLFGLDEDTHPDVLITDINSQLDGTRFQVEGISVERQTLQTPVIGAHNVENLVPALMYCYHEGMDVETLKQRSLELPKNSHGSIKIYPIEKATIIDDSYNSNPEGFQSVLDVMAKFPVDKKRIVITRGMIELAEKSEELHEMVAGDISFVANELIVTKKEAYTWFKKGIVEKYNIKAKLIEDPEKLLPIIKNYCKQDVIILLENRMHANIQEFINQYKPKE